VLVSEGLERLNRQTVEELCETFQVALHDILIDRAKTQSQSAFSKRKRRLNSTKKEQKVVVEIVSALLMVRFPLWEINIRPSAGRSYDTLTIILSEER
jgi:hypothetical protein